MTRKQSECGSAIVEIAISAAVISTVLLSGVVFFGTTMDVQNELLSRDLLEEKVRMTTQRVVHILREARLDTLSEVPESPDTSTSIVFQRVKENTLSTNLDEYINTRTKLASESPYAETYVTSRLELEDGEERIALTDSKLAVETNDKADTLEKNISRVTFSKKGRKVLVTIHAEGKGPDGEKIKIKRSTHVTLEN